MHLRIFQALFVLGVLGFLGSFLISLGGKSLDHVELPALFATDTIALPDGGRLTATMHLQRVQRYGSDGRFQNGWFVDADGGHFGIGLTSDGRVAVCVSRKRQVFVFELDGRSAGDPRPCRITSGVPKVLEAADFPHGELTLQRAILVDAPSPSLVPVLLVPLWHPGIAWLMFVIGFFGIGIVARNARQTGSDQIKTAPVPRS